MAPAARRIVVGYDGSRSSSRALEAAADLIGYGSTLAVVHVRREGEEAAASQERAREQLLERHVPARFLPRSGHPAREIVDAAASIDADLIVVGRQSPFDDTPGAVSVAVAQGARCDVLVVT